MPSTEDASQNTLKKNLDGIFKAKNIAVIGASSNPEKIGHQILKNLIDSGFDGPIYPVHPKEQEILGKKVFANIKDIPGDLDFVVICIPSGHVAAAMNDCAQKKVQGVAVITSGFSEVGNHDAEKEIINIANQNNIALIGPNILGVVYAPSKINASFGPRDVINGKIAFISQSGALAIALMGWTKMEQIGLASLVSLGNKADVEERQLIEYFNEDENVDVVLVYMEGLKDGRAFMQTQIKKPVVILKVGRSARGAKAAVSHTGSLAGSDKVFDAAFRQLGVLRANSFSQAFSWARTLSLPTPKGEDVIIITNGGGIGVRATDECEAADLKLLEDPDWTESCFRETMPDFGSSKNPIDITGGAHGAQYRKAASVGLREDKISALLVLYCETVVTDPMEIAGSLLEEYEATGRSKPFIVTMVGGERSREALHFLNKNGIPSFTSVPDAVSALKAVYEWKDMSTRPKDVPEQCEIPQEALRIIEQAKQEGRSALLEHEARQVLEICGVPTPPWGFARDLEEAKTVAKNLYPLAMKITSPDIIHKTDVGGVVVNIGSEEELIDRYNAMMETVKAKAPQAQILGVNLVQMIQGIECIIGLSQDPQFGPVVMFGLGGVFVEALKDVAFRIVPFGTLEAERLLDDIKAKNILEGFRGFAADKPSLIKTLCAVQKLSKHVKEVDINPLLTSKEGSFAVDARIIL